MAQRSFWRQRGSRRAHTPARITPSKLAIRSPFARSLHCEHLEDRRLLAILTVTTDQDVVDFNDGKTSLREAIFAANTVSGADEIRFDFGHEDSATILLTQGELKITDSLTVTGPGADLLTIDASGNDPTPDEHNGDGSRIFHITNSTASDPFKVLLTDLTLTGGDSELTGGAIHSSEILHISNSVLMDNSSIKGGAIFSNGSLEVVDSLISGNVARPTPGYSQQGSYGGGIQAEELKLVRSVVEGNRARIGAGALSGRTLIEQSSIVDNQGSGLYLTENFLMIDSVIAGNSQTGLTTRSDEGTIRNSTISGNGGVGVWAMVGDFRIEYSTITANGWSSAEVFRGGVLGSGFSSEVHVRSSIIAGNIGSDVRTLIISNSFVSEGYNRVGIGDSMHAFTQPNDQHGIIDPLLAPLADNGGPTLTHALLPGSPAINAGDPSLVAGVGETPEFDQRGTPFRRIAGGRIDIGAFEAQSLVVDTLVDESDGDYSPGDFSLREAIELANQIASLNTIEFDPSLSGGTILLTQGELTISQAVNIVGLGSELLTIDASGNDPTPDENNGDGSRAFNITASKDVSLAGMTVTGGDVTGNGGAVLGKDFSLLDMNIANNATIGAGGGISGNILFVVDSIITGNFSTGEQLMGGGIAAYGQLDVIRSTISNNESDTRFATGGGIWARGQVTIEHSLIDNNRTSAGSGGIRVESNSSDQVSIRHSTISNNVGTSNGGGIGVRGGKLTIENSTISDNTNTNGGGVWVGFNRTLNISDSVIRNNTAGAGGGIDFGGDFSTIARTIIENNHAVRGTGSETGAGGGINTRAGNMTIVDSILANNTAGSGGGVHASSVNITNSTIEGNSAEGSGGGVSALNGEITQSTISGNTATTGGGIYLGNSTQRFRLAHSTITLNSAPSLGGGIFSNGTDLQISHSIIAGNTGNNPDLAGILGVELNVSYSIVGTNTGNNLQPTFGTPDANGNLIGGSGSQRVNAQLGPLADNGGPTLTHALLPNSPALNKGNASAVLGANGIPELDQRGGPFTRITGGRIDIGAYESQAAAGALNGDFDDDGDVDGRDFLAWQRGVGTNPASKADGDATGNKLVNTSDLAVWQETYGNSLTENSVAAVEVFFDEEPLGLTHQFDLQPITSRSENPSPSPSPEYPGGGLAVTDFAFTNWSPNRLSYASFGELVVRRNAPIFRAAQDNKL